MSTHSFRFGNANGDDPLLCPCAHVCLFRYLLLSLHSWQFVSFISYIDSLHFPSIISKPVPTEWFFIDKYHFPFRFQCGDVILFPLTKIWHRFRFDLVDKQHPQLNTTPCIPPDSNIKGSSRILPGLLVPRGQYTSTNPLHWRFSIKLHTPLTLAAEC